MALPEKAGMKLARAEMFLCLLPVLCLTARSQITHTGTTSDDSFLATGSPANPAGTDLTDLNFGSAGVLVIAPAASANGQYQSILKFQLADAAALFNATFASNWAVSAMTLDFACNFGTEGAQPDNAMFGAVNGGQFVIEWLADNDWVEGTGKPRQPTMDGVTYGSLPTLLAGAHENLVTNTYVPPGDNAHVFWPLPLDTNLTASVADGGALTLLLYAADNQVNYLFNSHNFGNGNQPQIHITAVPLPWITSGFFTNGAFRINGLATANASCTVQLSTNLATSNWQSLGTVTANANGVIQFEDTSVSNRAQSFYRLKN